MKTANLPSLRRFGGLMAGMTLVVCCGIAPAIFSAEPTQKGGLRVYRERNARGEEILTVTNLDELGRRIGGELPPTARSVAASPECSNGQEAASAAPPVIINVYSAPQSGGYFEPNGPDGYTGYDGYQAVVPYGAYGGYGGYLSGYYPNGGGNHHRHMQQPTGLFSRPPIIDKRPYQRGTAAQRNRAAFHRH